MVREAPFDLFSFIESIASAIWLEEIYIFGSRRYLTNTSYASDIDLLLVPNKIVSTAEVRGHIEEPYIDAFILAGGIAISVGNDTRIEVNPDNICASLNAVLLWSRSRGWNAGVDYRVLTILADRVPTMTVASAGAHPVILFCALPAEFKSVLDRLPLGKT